MPSARNLADFGGAPPASACEPRAWRRPADLAAHRKGAPRTSEGTPPRTRVFLGGGGGPKEGRGAADYPAIAVMMGSLDFGPLPAGCAVCKYLRAPRG